MKDSNLNGDGMGLSLSKLAKLPDDVQGCVPAYHRMGLAVVPNEGKKPLLEGWPSRHLTEDEIPLRFGNGQNVGLLNGEPSGGLVTVDMDVSEALKIADRYLIETARSGREGTPGAHAWYSSPGAKTKKWLDVDGTMLVEVRSDGCQTLAPSVHPCGERYLWDRDGVSEPAEVAPEELERRCTELATATVLARHMPPIGGRHEYAKAAIGVLIRRLGKEAALKVVRSAWHATDADSPDALRDLDGIAEDTERRLTEGDNTFGVPTLSEMVPGLPDLLGRWWGWNESNRADTRLDNEDPTDDVLRDRWLEIQEQPIAFGQEQWHRYGAGFWVPVHDQIVYGEVDGVLEEAKPEGVKPNAGRRSSIERMAQAKAFVSSELWDANQDILVCQNGTLEISSGTLREHRPEDYALAAVPYDFDPSSQAPAWYEFLATTVPEAAPFLQEFAGYSLTVDTSLETAVWLYGPPGTGKSTYIEGQRAMLGNRAGLLGLADIQRSRFALANLPGKTLVVATEQPSDFIHSTHILNAIISGEEVTVERKFKDAFTFTPKAKLLWAMNDTPRVRDANDGLFRRVKVVSFPRLRVEPDPDLKERIRGEGAGILNWALEGLRRVKERGYFEIPEIVRESTDEFRRTSDVPRMFVEEACIVSDLEGTETQAKVLYDWYKTWCLDNGHKPMSSTAVAKEWRRLGFGKRSLGGRSFYTGVEVDPGWITAHEDSSRSW